jgi:hypothetical protein
MILTIETDKICQNPKILSIVTYAKSGMHQWVSEDYTSEDQMVQAFLSWFLKEKDKIIVGYNILKFDIPILLLKLKDEAFFAKINKSNVVDLFTILTFLNRGKLYPLDHYCKQEGIDIKTYDSLRLQHREKAKQINKLFHKIWQKIKLSPSFLA